MEERKREKEVVPLDIVMNILKRVPVKSLMRFKEWLNLPTNPYFIKQQLQHSNASTANRHLSPSPSASSDPTTTSSTNLISPTSLCSTPVPTPTVMPFHDVGFGFSSLTDDYKIVRISMCVIFKQPKVDRAEVYSLTSGSWREINAVKLHNLGLVSRSVAITGTIFWLASRTFSSTHYEFVVSFDIGRELFTLMIGPQMPSSPSPTFNNYELVVCNDELAMFCNCIARNFVSCSFDLWVLKDFNCDYDDDRRDGGGESWVKMYSVGPFSGLVYPLSLWKDEIVCRERLKILKQLQPDRDEFCYVPFTYIESLIPV
uniref:F-box associated beta-propeller type 1 domain-containing protein n=1 Tax=Phaseolus vulgaris TaxID=3885 RepID=V7BTL5_PHAVU|nr:hypothetical protein PHAVU_006G204600g [Phaseolus vulgaris]ESW20385.1 hypothetical protein PHAVU_006G204600g [Phaseolus vulgaris]